MSIAPALRTLPCSQFGSEDPAQGQPLPYHPLSTPLPCPSPPCQKDSHCSCAGHVSSRLHQLEEVQATPARITERLRQKEPLLDRDHTGR